MLNEFQRRAVERSLREEDLFLIHGPPGTGKTTTLVASIEAHVREGMRVLACADSNVAVDNILERLVERGVRAVRVGNPVRVHEGLRGCTLEEVVRRDPRFKEVEELYRRIEELKERRSRFTQPLPKFRRGLEDSQILDYARRGISVRGLSPGLIRSMAGWIEISTRIKEIYEKARSLERSIVREVLSGAEVVCATNSAAGSEHLEGMGFDVVFIDEATQATEPSCLIPLVRGRKLVMAGDHKQLPPTVISVEAGDLSLSLFERLMDLCGNEVSQMLRIQYRMNERIMEFPSRTFYGGLLIAHESVRHHTIADLGFDLSKVRESLREVLAPENVVVFVGVRGGEVQREGSTSYMNPKEAEVVEALVEDLLRGGLGKDHLGVISPYEDQVDLLAGMVPVEVRTVDGFQGREKEVIVVSLVRSNPRRDIGFLKDYRRLNVALTRARRKLIVVGDPETLSADGVYRSFLEYVRRRGLFKEL
jgi:predicted DNA helicase